MDLSRLSSLLISLGSPHQFLVQSFKDKAVYHYTDLNALRGIVTDRDLWLTNSRFSNDYEEVEHGKCIAEESILNRSRRSDLSEPERRFARNVGKQLQKRQGQDVYVCCFCLEDDLLGQWRSYGANGTGVSLGFATDQFQSIAGQDTNPDMLGLIYLWRVFYDPKKQGAIVEDCLNQAWKIRGDPNEDKIALAVDAIRFFIPTFKNEAFSDEREARLVFLPSPNCNIKLRFRVGRGMLIPYYSLKEIAEVGGNTPWKPPLTQIHIGPSSNKEITRQGVELLLKHEAEYSDVRVAVSNAPYRG